MKRQRVLFLLAVPFFMFGGGFLAGVSAGVWLGGAGGDTAEAVYARGALSVAMRDGCQKEFDLKAGKYPPGVAYGSPAYRAYTFEHGEPHTCDELARVLREIGER